MWHNGISGLPVGLQMFGNAFADRLVLGCCSLAYEKATLGEPLFFDEAPTNHNVILRSPLTLPSRPARLNAAHDEGKAQMVQARRCDCVALFVGAPPSLARKVWAAGHHQGRLCHSKPIKPNMMGAAEIC